MHKYTYFVVRVRCRRKESSRSLFHYLMSFFVQFNLNSKLSNFLSQLWLAWKFEKMMSDFC